MARPLRITPPVLDDLGKAIRWYDRISVALGNRFRATISAGLDDVQRDPELHPFAFGDLNVRFFRVRRFPYLILYRAEAKSVIVLAVRHSASDLQRIRRRISGI